MNRDRIHILMNREIDGENSPDESRELEAALAADPGQRRRFTELKEALGIFLEVESLTPSPGLRESILEATEPTATPRTHDWRGDFRNLLRPVLRPAVTGSFTVGLVAGLLIFTVFLGPENRGLDQKGLVQGMAGHDRDTLTAADSLVRSLDDERIRGQLRLWTGPHAAVLTIDLEAVPGTRVRVSYGPDLDCIGFENRVGRAADLRIAGGAVGFMADRVGRYDLEWNRTGNTMSPIKIQIHHEGELVAEHNLVTGSDR